MANASRGIMEGESVKMSDGSRAGTEPIGVRPNILRAAGVELVQQFRRTTRYFPYEMRSIFFKFHILLGNIQRGQDHYCHLIHFRCFVRMMVGNPSDFPNKKICNFLCPVRFSLGFKSIWSSEQFYGDKLFQESVTILSILLTCRPDN